jgi:hypothetical protein
MWGQRGLRRDDGGKVTNVQYKSNENPPYNEYILIKVM